MGLYGDRIPRAVLRSVVYAGRGDNRIRMTAEVQECAQRILVHSREQVELLELDRRRRSAPVELVPFAIPAVDPAPASAPAEPPLIVTSGALTPALLAAFGRIEADHPGARLAPRDQLTEEELGRARLAVRLQPDGDAGRPSEDVSAFIAAGIPTFVTDVGWQGEMPEPVVMKVPAETSAAALGEQMSAVLSDPAERTSIRAAQSKFATENSFARTAERYAELLGL